MFESPRDLTKRKIETVGYHAMRGIKTDVCFFLQDVQVTACVGFSMLGILYTVGLYGFKQYIICSLSLFQTIQFFCTLTTPS